MSLAIFFSLLGSQKFPIFPSARFSSLALGGCLHHRKGEKLSSGVWFPPQVGADLLHGFVVRQIEKMGVSIVEKATLTSLYKLLSAHALILSDEYKELACSPRRNQ
jgi:hypothetical protein